MNAFRNVDVGACILLFRKGQEKQNKVHHVTLNTLPETEQLLDCMKRQTPATQDLSFGSLVTKLQDNLLETSKWFTIGTTESNRDQWQKSGLVVPLKSLAKVMRGIATGANAFFGLSQKDVEQFELEPYVVRTIHRNREIQEIILDEAHWQGLADDGKRVWLLYLNSEVINSDTSLGIYLTKGEMKGYHQRSLVKTRKKWYAMEQRDIPPIFFTLLTRGIHVSFLIMQRLDRSICSI
jgi:hypothetical protein